MKNKNNYLFALIGLFFLVACSNNSEGTSKESASKTVEPTGLSSEKMTPENLETILPDAFLGMPKKISSKGNPKMKGGAEVSMARLIYREEDREVQFEIYDSGTVGSTMDSYLSWIGQTLNVDNDQMTEKNSTFEGFPAYEKYIKADKKTELHVLPNKRFELVLKGSNVTIEELKEGLKVWDITNSIVRLK